MGARRFVESLEFCTTTPSPLKPPWIAMRGSIVKIRLLELAQHHAQFHQHAPHEVFWRLIAQTSPTIWFNVCPACANSFSDLRSNRSAISAIPTPFPDRSEEHTSELQSRRH